MTAPSATARVIFRGVEVDYKTRAFLQVMERRLGYELTIVQGSYSTAVEQSGGTHAGGGVVDLAPFDHKRKVRVARDLGAAVWYRGLRRRADGSILWRPHIHLVIIGHQTLSVEAKAQVVKYLSGQDGLAGSRPDPNPYRPVPAPPPFNYRLSNRDDALRLRILDMKGRVRTLQDRISAARSRYTYRRGGVN